MGSVLEEAMPEFDEVPPYVPGIEDAPTDAMDPDPAIGVSDGEEPAVPDEEPVTVPEPPGV